MARPPGPVDARVKRRERLQRKIVAEAKRSGMTEEEFVEAALVAAVNKSTNDAMAQGVRHTLRVNSDTQMQLLHWSKKTGMSINEFIIEAIDLKIAYENGDYDLPRAEIQRLNQLIDLIGSLAKNSTNLERVVVSGFDSLIGIARGDNSYLGEEA